MYRILQTVAIFAVCFTISGIKCMSFSMPAFSSPSASAPVIEGAQSAEELVKQADAVRAPWPGFAMRADLSYEKFNKRKEETFRVFTRDYVKTLVSYIDPVKQRGNMLLMINDNIWYYVSKTQRPMRITPIQKLSGGASYGDITRLSWSGDYDPVIEGESRITVNGKTYAGWLLKLTARSKSATYHTMDLYVDKEKGYPRKAVVYLQSGKKMKTMYFIDYKMIAGKMMNTRIDFVDHLSLDAMTSMIFSNITVKQSPDRFFLKSALPSLSSEAVY